jgi:hypothetical protein
MFAASKSGKAAAAAAATDPYFPYVPLLLNTTSTNGQQNNTFLDSSTNNFTITRNGTPTQGSFTPYQPSGYWSGYFSGSATTQISVTPTISAIGTGNFTIEFFYFWTSDTGIDQQIIDLGTTGFSIYSLTSSANIGVYNRVTNTEIFSPTSYAITKNSWVHVALVRSGTGAGQTALYINGTSVATAAVSSNFSSTSANIGCRYAAVGSNWYPVNGYISNLRISNNARTITVPTAPYSSDANTLFLGLQSNRFINSSGTALTTNGTPQVQAFQPFSPPASYAAATYGGSGVFNGSTDYLSLADNAALQLSTGDFTIEGWFYISGATSTAYNLISKGAAATGWSLNTTTGARIQFSYTASNLTGSTTTLVANAWYHIAVVRSGSASGNLKIYLNGVQEIASAGAVNDDFNQTSTMYISASRTATVPLNGYSSNIRVVKGTAIYTAAFTPPTLPVTAVSGTSLLTNFGNAGIYDAAWQNNALTVGDAQASTTQYKWSPTSMKFDGTGDIVSCPASQGFVFTGNLTIEGWVWIDSTMASSRPDNLKVFIFTGWDTGNTPQFYVTGTTTTPGTGLGYYDGTTGYTATVTVPKDQWVYLAFVRSGSAIYGYVNGTQYTIASSFSSTIGSLNTLVIGGNPNQSTAYYSYLKGYIQDLRITKGVARTITTPTAAFPTR